ncbi:unnamed protein product [Boreogadus saida]
MIQQSYYVTAEGMNQQSYYVTAEGARQPTLKQQRPISDSIRGGQGPSSLEDRLYYWTTSIPIPMETPPRGSETNSLSLLAHVARS